MTGKGEAIPCIAPLVLRPNADTGLVLVCEHASHHFPSTFGALGLPQHLLDSHIAWDPGALAVATEMSQMLGAPLLASRVSRLLYDCNRPPEAQDAMAEHSEVHDIPGNQKLSREDRQLRINAIYRPFEQTLTALLNAQSTPPALVTVHSFTPVYRQQRREVEIGVLHDEDSRLADALLQIAGEHLSCDVRRNAPYGPEDGVTHTLKTHALPRGCPNVMLEIRNDLIASPELQTVMAKRLCAWLQAAIARVRPTATGLGSGDSACHE